jgi:hypothetical protein
MYSKTTLFTLMLILTKSGACQEAADNSVHIQVPALVSSDAHGPVNRAFTTWSLEFVQFNETVGVGGKPNIFSENLIRNLLSATGGRPFWTYFLFRRSPSAVSQTSPRIRRHNGVLTSWLMLSSDTVAEATSLVFDMLIWRQTSQIEIETIGNVLFLP